MKPSQAEIFEAMTQEESHWQTVYFQDFEKPSTTIVVEKHEHNGYTLSQVAGTNIAVLDRLDSLPKRDITQEQALGLRRRYDASWASRSQLREKAERLCGAGILAPLGANALSGTIELVHEYKRASSIGITISADGSISTELSDPVQIDVMQGQSSEMYWHEYELLPHVSYAVHRVKRTDHPQTIDKIVYNPSVIVREVFQWFKIAEKVTIG